MPDQAPEHSVPKVEDARALAKRYPGIERIVILFVSAETENAGRQVGYASWGRDRALCQDTRRLADRLFEDAVDHLADPGSEGT